MGNKKQSTNSQSVLLYNTQNIDGELLKLGFSIRKKEYQRIWKDIKAGTMERPETHYLIQGVRGAGKTTLLSRLAYEVTEDTDLNNWLIPILLNEEEYGILSLFTFWLRLAEKLADYNAEKYTSLYQQLLDLKSDDSSVAWELIRYYLDENGQKIIVFVDNLGELFQDFDDIEQAQLREALSLHPQIRLIGGSSQLLEAHYDGNAPFYQFFKLINLKSISEEEMHELLRSLAKQAGEEAVATIEDIITNHPERIEAVRRLTDGVPRTIVLLFQIIMEGAKESSYAYLEETIDKTTPLYKHRMDDLPRQQKAIVHAIAMNWDAMSTKEIAEQTRLPSKTVSAQLVKLQKQWIIDKVETDTKNHLYLIKERFFNIWYLMRYGNEKDRRRVLWLTRFLESWYDRNELNFKLVEIAMPYLNKKKDVRSKKFEELFINALLASDSVDESLKYGVNTYLKPFYKNLIKNKEYEYFFDNINKCLEEIELKNYPYAKSYLKKALDLDIGVSGSLLCLRIIDSFFKDDEELKSSIVHKISKESSKSSVSVLVLLAKIIYEDDISAKKLGLALITKLSLKGYKQSLIFIIFKTYIHLWFDMYEYFKNDIAELREYSLDKDLTLFSFDFFESLLLLLLQKKQTEVILNLMEIFPSIKEQFKPIYYATVSLLKDERHQEYLRMGPELKDTVDEILQKVEEYRVKYD